LVSRIKLEVFEWCRNFRDYFEMSLLIVGDCEVCGKILEAPNCLEIAPKMSFQG
jgi:hypothetical protein